MTHLRLPRRRWLPVLTLAVATALSACGGGDGDDDDDDGAPPPVTVADTIAVTASNRIVSFARATPGTLVSDLAVLGLAVSESIVGIDVRPADNKVYALSSMGRIYTVDPATGTLTLKAESIPTAGDDNPYAGLVGTAFAVDFNPVADRLRVVGNTGQNLRINVDTGAVITDGAINGATAAITAAGYTNSFTGTTTTQLFDLDVAAGTLYLQNPPNDGTLSAPKPLGVTATASNGFDIDPANNTGYAALVIGGTTRLYTVSLATGAATAVGTIGSGEPLVGMALNGGARTPLALALTADNRLASFNPAAPNTITASVAIGGLQAGEFALGMDIRPADGRLYVLTSLGRLLTVDPANGTSTLASTLAADPADLTAPYAGLGPATYSVDFNPLADRLRVVTDTGVNLRINVATGATTTDTPINRVGLPPSVVGAAYTNSFAGTTSTRLFDLDAVQDVLAEQVPPNDGTLVNVAGAGLGIDVAAASPLDIAGGDNGLVLAALRTGTSGPFSLYTVSLTTGAATLYRNTGNAALSQIGGATGPAIVDIAIRF